MITLAATSAGEWLTHSAGPKQAAPINPVRARYRRFRANLQQRGTNSAKGLRKKRSGKERRFAKEVQQWLSKALVQTAQGTGRGSALADLKPIRERAGNTVGKR